MSKIEVDAITQQSGSTLTVGGGASKTVVADATTVTLGRCGGTVALASGASQTGFGRTGTVDWQTGSIKTSTFTAVNGQGFFCDTNSGAFTVNLPAGSAGAIVSLQDYRNTFDTGNLTVTPNGSEKINTGVGSIKLTTEGEGITLVYVDSTVGWRSIQDNVFSDAGSNFISATGGTITCSGNCRIHTFTGPGTFSVSALAVCAANNQVSYMVVAGGGAGGRGNNYGSGGGAGGFREDKSPTTPYTASPLEGAGPITVTATDFPITVGGGAATTSSIGEGGSGSTSSFSTITSAGGGGGGGHPGYDGQAGGSGGGSGSNPPGSGTNAGAGNTPPVSPPQGNVGGSSAPGTNQQAGGGGATAAGNSGTSGTGGYGGAGATTAIAPASGSPATNFSGGGGGGGGTAGGSGGSGGGGAGSANNAPGGVGTANTGGGGGGNGPTNGLGGAGGSGIVVIRYKKA